MSGGEGDTVSGVDLTPCSHCGGFVPSTHLSTCPHCGVSGPTAAPAARSRTATVLGALGGGAIAMTLMACYGAPPPHHQVPTPPDPTTPASSSATPPFATPPPPAKPLPPG